MRLREQDKVYDIVNERRGIVKTIYPEINIAIVYFDGDVDKVLLDDLVLLKEDPEEDYIEEKRAGLLDRIKGRFR